MLTSDRLAKLARELDALVKDLAESPKLDERRRLLRRMKVLIVEMDMLILSTLREDAVSSPSYLHR
jgi:hypothetical protein